MDGVGECFAQQNKSEKDKYPVISLICAILKNKTGQHGGGSGEKKQTRKQTLNYRE